MLVKDVVRNVGLFGKVKSMLVGLSAASSASDKQCTIDVVGSSSRVSDSRREEVILELRRVAEDHPATGTKRIHRGDLGAQG